MYMTDIVRNELYRSYRQNMTCERNTRNILHIYTALLQSIANVEKYISERYYVTKPYSSISMG